MSKLLPGKGIAQMDLDKRNLNGQKGIPQGNAGVRESAGVQNDKLNPIDRRALDSIDEFVFGIALETRKPVSQFSGNNHATFLDIGETGFTVDTGFAGSE